eukprot:6152631-Pleurochrysis_carterae.AAC.5
MEFLSLPLLRLCFAFLPQLIIEVELLVREARMLRFVLVKEAAQLRAELCMQRVNLRLGWPRDCGGHVDRPAHDDGQRLLQRHEGRQPRAADERDE